jgi:hypothetical protein
MTIERLPSEDIEDVYAKERTYREIRQTHLARWRKLANLWVSAYFGNTMSREEYRDLALRLQGRSEESMLRESQAQPYLTHPALDRPDYFHWELEFPEVFFDEYGRALGEAAGFDAVVGNPPYVVFVKEGKGRQSEFIIYQVISDNEAKYYGDQYKLVEYAPNTFSLMTERSLRILANNALFGFIYPSTILYYFYYKLLRSYLTKQTTLRSIVQLEHVFDEAETGGNAIVVFKKQHPENNDVIVLRVPSPEHLLNSVGSPVSQEKFLQIPWTQWTTSPHLLNLLQKSKLNCIALEELGDFYQGVCTGNNKKWITVDSRNPLSVMVLRGKDIHRYSTNWNGEFLIFDKEKMWSNTNEDLLEAKPKILLRQTSDSIVASVDYEGLYLIDSLYLFRPETNWDIGYLLAVLNSSLMNMLYRFYSPEENRTFAQVKVVNLKPLPIKKIVFNTPVGERTAVVQTAKAHYEAGELTAVLAWCESELGNGRNDTIHDLLAYLAGQMIDLNRAQQELVARFWLDLEGILADPDTFAKLRHKGKWAQSLHKKVAAARPYVDSDSRSTITLDASLGWNEEAFTGFVRELAGSVRRQSGLVDVYQDHAGEYGRLARQITTTDHLIDQIVYRLYGLTDDEIAIVEGA